MPRFLRTIEIDAPRGEVFAWHARPGAFERLVPPWERLRVIEREGGIEDGARTVLEMRAGPVPVRWTAVHRDYRPPEQFCDEQRGGPFRRWIHSHRFVALDGARTRLEDDIDYALPFGALGALADPLAVRPRLARTFRYRHDTTRGDLHTHRHCALSPRRIAITGASGLIGTALGAFLSTGGHTITRLVRRTPAAPDEARWWPEPDAGSRAALEGSDAVVHLAAANVAGRRWDAAWKRELRDSRVAATAALARTLASLERKPAVLICASGAGIYGHRPGERLTERSTPGEGFLADLAQAWEAAAAPAADAGIRVVFLRIGVVLTPAGGALARLLPAFNLGVGGPVGDGSAVMSWVSLDDVLGAVLHGLARPVAGPINVTAPAPVTSAEFAATLGRVLRRPAVVPVPRAAVAALYGEMGTSLLFTSARVLPARLQADGFVHRHPEIEGALRHMLGRQPDS
jgi:uncharacterized protein (TIGR01777 family)